MDRKADIYNMLRKKGHRITAQKRVILDVFFEHSDRMLSVNNVYSLIPESVNIDNATIYRNIQRYLSLGILELMIDDHGISKYTICDEGHHHYFICTECGGITKFPCVTNAFWKPYAKESCFEETHHKIEVYGKCVHCK